MNEALARIKVILTAAPTYLTALAVAASVFAQEVGPGPVAEWAVTIGAWLTSAVVIIRQVTPVAKDERGIL